MEGQDHGDEHIDGIEFDDLENNPLVVRMNEQMRIYISGFTMVKPSGMVFPVAYKIYASYIKNFEVWDDDIWVVSYPKTGTTWLQEMVWCIRHDLDFEGAKEDLYGRFPYFELRTLWDNKSMEFAKQKRIEAGIPVYDSNKEDPLPFFRDSFRLTEKLKAPRCIKSHLALTLLPDQVHQKKPKIIYIAREPKDACVSFFYHNQIMAGYIGSFEDFAEYFLNETVIFGSYWDHVLEFWKIRNEPNVLFLRYEDMKKDLSVVIRNVAEFLGKTLKEDEIMQLKDHLSFENMKENRAVNYEPIFDRFRLLRVTDKSIGSFLRKGQTGDWKNHMAEDIAAKFNRKTREKFKGTDLYP